MTPSCGYMSVEGLAIISPLKPWPSFTNHVCKIQLSTFDNSCISCPRQCAPLSGNALCFPPLVRETGCLASSERVEHTGSAKGFSNLIPFSAIEILEICMNTVDARPSLLYLF